MTQVWPVDVFSPGKFWPCGVELKCFAIPVLSLGILHTATKLRTWRLKVPRGPTSLKFCRGCYQTFLWHPILRPILDISYHYMCVPDFVRFQISLAPQKQLHVSWGNMEIWHIGAMPFIENSQRSQEKVIKVLRIFYQVLGGRPARRSPSRYKTYCLLLPVGSATTLSEYCHILCQ